MAMSSVGPLDRAMEAVHASHETSRKHSKEDTIATLSQLKEWQSQSIPESEREVYLPLCNGVVLAEGSFLLNTQTPVKMQVGDGKFMECSIDDSLDFLLDKKKEKGKRPDGSTTLNNRKQSTTASINEDNSKKSTPQVSVKDDHGGGGGITKKSNVTAPAKEEEEEYVDFEEEEEDFESFGVNNNMSLFEIEERVDENGNELSSRLIDVKSKIEETDIVRKVLISKTNGPDDDADSDDDDDNSARRRIQKNFDDKLPDMINEELEKINKEINELSGHDTNKSRKGRLDEEMISYEETERQLDMLIQMEEEEEEKKAENIASHENLQSQQWSKGFFSGGGSSNKKKVNIRSSKNKVGDKSQANIKKDLGPSDEKSHNQSNTDHSSSSSNSSSSRSGGGGGAVREVGAVTEKKSVISPAQMQSISSPINNQSTVITGVEPELASSGVTSTVVREGAELENTTRDPSKRPMSKFKAERLARKQAMGL